MTDTDTTYPKLVMVYRHGGWGNRVIWVPFILDIYNIKKDTRTYFEAIC